MRKFIVITSVALLGLVTLSGCSSSSPKEPASTTSTSGTDSSPADTIVLGAPELDENGLPVGPPIPIVTPAPSNKKMKVYAEPKDSPKGEAGFGHAAPSKEFSPADNGLPTEGIPGVYAGGVLQSATTIGYRWYLPRPASPAAAKAQAVDVMAKIDATMIAEGWEPVSPILPVRSLDFKIGDSINAMTGRSYVKDGIGASVQLRCSDSPAEEYNMIVIGAWEPPVGVELSERP